MNPAAAQRCMRRDWPRADGSAAYSAFRRVRGQQRRSWMGLPALVDTNKAFT